MDHFLLVDDALAYALVLDAITHPGPADPARISRTTCLQTLIPGSDLVSTALIGPVAIANVISRLASARRVTREPELQCPFDARACPPPQVHLTRRCARGRHLRIAVIGDVHVVRAVDFKLGRRLIRRDTAAPFATTLARMATRLARGGRLRAVVTLSDPAGERRILSRPLPRC